MGRQPHMLWEALEEAASLGFVGVELVQGWPPGFAYPDPEDTRRVDALRKLYDRYGPRILGIQAAPVGGAYDPSASGRDAWLASMARQARLVERLGGNVLGHWPGAPFSPRSADECIGLFVDSGRRAADAAARLGVTIAIEIEPVFELNRFEWLARIVKDVGHPNWRAIYDPSHFDYMNGGTGRPEELLARLGVANVGHVHFTDTNGTLRGAGTSKHLACGDGHIDVARNLDALWRGGYRGWIMLDCWEVPDQFDALRKGKAALDAARRRQRQSGRTGAQPPSRP